MCTADLCGRCEFSGVATATGTNANAFYAIRSQLERNVIMNRLLRRDGNSYFVDFSGLLFCCMLLLLLHYSLLIVYSLVTPYSLSIRDVAIQPAKRRLILFENTANLDRNAQLLLQQQPQRRRIQRDGMEAFNRPNRWRLFDEI